MRYSNIDNLEESNVINISLIDEIGVYPILGNVYTFRFWNLSTFKHDL